MIRGDRGSVTVEAAFAVSAVVVVLALALGGYRVLITQLRCVDAAREAARLVARGEAGRVAETVREVGPSGATHTVSYQGGLARVEVSAPSLGGPVPWRVTESAYVTVEGERP